MYRLRFSSGMSFAIAMQSILRRTSVSLSFPVFDRRYFPIEKDLSISVMFYVPIISGTYWLLRIYFEKNSPEYTGDISVYKQYVFV